MRRLTATRRRLRARVRACAVSQCACRVVLCYGSDAVEEVRAKEVEAATAEADYRRLVATGKAKLEFGIAEGDLWTYFCMARLCAGNRPIHFQYNETLIHCACAVVCVRCH